MSSRRVAVSLGLTLAAGCLPAVAPPPLAGYGAPYRGTGEPIYVKDSRTDWTITEGGRAVTSEHALEATGDAEYEARRQLAKDYNAKLYREGLSHHQWGTVMLAAGVVVALAGVAAYKTYSGTTGGQYGGGAAMLLGTGLAYEGYWGGGRPPPYHRWHTPGPLDHPAYLRQQIEPYNERIGAPAVADQPGSVESLAPGQRRPPPPKAKPAAGSPPGKPRSRSRDR